MQRVAELLEDKNKIIRKYLRYREEMGQYDPEALRWTPLGDMSKENIAYLLKEGVLIQKDGEVKTVDHREYGERGKYIKSSWGRFVKTLDDQKGKLAREKGFHHLNYNQVIEYMRTGKVTFPEKYTFQEVEEFVEGYEKAYPDRIITS